MPETQETQNSVKTLTLVDLLGDEQRRVLFARFNKTWNKANGDAVKSIMKEYAFDYNTAAILRSMQVDADTLLSNERVTDTVESILKQTRSLFGSEHTRKEALRSIKNEYEALDPFEAKAAGKNARVKILKDNTRADGGRIIDMLLETLEISEAEWM
jgi:hypothetical protein